MLEFPEVQNIAKQLQNNIVSKKVSKVLPPTKPHKFCWYYGNPSEYDAKIKGSKVSLSEGFGIFVEISFDNGFKLCFHDGINVRLVPSNDIPKDYRLVIEFDDGFSLVFTITMYGGIYLYNNSFDYKYYIKSKQAVSPFSLEFNSSFYNFFAECRPNLSAKAFLATEQRFPGLGNGVLQDILLAAGINPKRKISSLSDSEKEELLYCISAVLKDMTEHGGRDTEKDIFGKQGGYKTQLSKNTLNSGCPQCGGTIIKETYMGGAVYYCPSCQPLK